jgi:hypothetical protein
MDAGLSAWQQITRCLFIVAFTDKHSSFPLCPAERTYNVIYSGISGRKTITKHISRKMLSQMLEYQVTNRQSPIKLSKLKKIKGAITVVSPLKMEHHMTILYMPPITQNGYTHFYHS